MSLETPRPNPVVITDQEAAIKKRALNPWVTVAGKIDLMTRLFPLRHSFFKKHRDEIKGYYELIYKQAAGTTLSDDDSYHLAKFELDAKYQPGLSRLQAVVRETIYRTPEEMEHRFSHGTKIHRRIEKEKQRVAAENAEMERVNAPFIAAREAAARRLAEAKRLEENKRRWGY